MRKPIKIDIHNQKKKVESIKNNMYKKFSDENAGVTCNTNDNRVTAGTTTRQEQIVL